LALAHSRPVRELWFSPDGHRLVTGGGEDRARIWEIATPEGTVLSAGRLVAMLPHQEGDEVWRLCFSPDGGRVLTARGGTTRRAHGRAASAAAETRAPGLGCDVQPGRAPRTDGQPGPDRANLGRGDRPATYAASESWRAGQRRGVQPGWPAGGYAWNRRSPCL